MEKGDFWKMKKVAILASIVLLAGCAAYYPPMTQHTYITNTQAHHKLAGLRIVCEPEDFSSLANPVLQGVFLTNSSVEYFIDGRLVGRHNSAKPFETFVQLPPGEHMISVLLVAQGVVTLGMKATECELKYGFELEEGQKGEMSIETIVCVDKQDKEEGKDLLTLKDFSDVEDWWEE